MSDGPQLATSRAELAAAREAGEGHGERLTEVSATVERLEAELAEERAEKESFSSQLRQALPA